MPSMLSYPRRLQSGHFTCYLNRTYHVLTTRCNQHVWQPVEKYSRVENSPNGSEPTVELKTRRCCLINLVGSICRFRHLKTVVLEKKSAYRQSLFRSHRA